MSSEIWLEIPLRILQEISSGISRQNLSETWLEIHSVILLGIPSGIFLQLIPEIPLQMPTGISSEFSQEISAEISLGMVFGIPPAVWPKKFLVWFLPVYRNLNTSFSKFFAILTCAPLVISRDFSQNFYKSYSGNFNLKSWNFLQDFSWNFTRDLFFLWNLKALKDSSQCCSGFSYCFQIFLQWSFWNFAYKFSKNSSQSSSRNPYE